MVDDVNRRRTHCGRERMWHGMMVVVLMRGPSIQSGVVHLSRGLRGSLLLLLLLLLSVIVMVVEVQLARKGGRQVGMAEVRACCRRQPSKRTARLRACHAARRLAKWRRTCHLRLTRLLRDSRCHGCCGRGQGARWNVVRGHDLCGAD